MCKARTRWAAGVSGRTLCSYRNVEKVLPIGVTLMSHTSLTLVRVSTHPHLFSTLLTHLFPTLLNSA